jgi:uncharacterized protein YjiS (DUF1127 family)
MRHEMIDISMLDYRRLTAEQRIAVKREAIARAHAERRRAFREVLAGLAALLSKPALVIARRCKALRARHAQSIAAAKLRSLSDRELKDIGVCRCEINALVFAGRA